MDSPGSKAAGLKGCICPVLDNSHGRGYLCQPNVFVIREDCPLHTKTSPKVQVDVREPVS